MVHKILKIDSIFTNHNPLIGALVPFQFNSPSIFNQTGTHFLLQNFRIIFKQENIFSLRLPNESRNEICYFSFFLFPTKLDTKKEDNDVMKQKKNDIIRLYNGVMKQSNDQITYQMKGTLNTNTFETFQTNWSSIFRLS